ncbi:MAG: adenosine deaminase [Pseudomonadota bacterium]
MISNFGRDLRSLPKAHLHIHLEGAMRSSTLTELCTRYGIDRPPDTAGQKFDNFGGFLTMYWAACNSVRTREDLARLIRELAEDAVQEGVWWIETAFDAARYSTLRADSPFQLFETQKEGWLFALKAAESASKATGVGIGFISAADRIMPLDQAITRAEVTRDLIISDQHVVRGGMACFDEPYPGIVAFGLHGNEGGHPPEPFAEAFRIALDGTGLMSVPHAGEIAPVPGGGPASVWGAMDHLRADRIAHGVLAIEDDALVSRLAQKKICLDVCPTSNLLLRVFPSAEEHPLPEFLRAGVPCTLGSDDPLLFGPDLVDEFVLCREQMGMDDEQLAAMARNSFTYSGAPMPVRQAGLAAVDAWLSA